MTRCSEPSATDRVDDWVNRVMSHSPRPARHQPSCPYCSRTLSSVPAKLASRSCSCGRRSSHCLGARRYRGSASPAGSSASPASSCRHSGRHATTSRPHRHRPSRQPQPRGDQPTPSRALQHFGHHRQQQQQRNSNHFPGRGLLVWNFGQRFWKSPALSCCGIPESQRTRFLGHHRGPNG